MSDPRRPFLVELDSPAPDPAQALPIPEATAAPPQTALVRALRVTRPSGPAVKIFFGAMGAFLSFAASVAAYEFIAGLMARNAVLGWIGLVLAILAFGSLLWMAGREWAAYLRLGRIDALRAQAAAALLVEDIKPAQQVLARLDSLYAARPEMAWARTRVTEQADQLLDPDAMLRLAEVELLGAPDQAARREIEAAARKVAAATALVPLALVDVAVALAANLRMIRRVAEIYGGRAGMMGSVQVLRRVMTHLLATGVVAVGDDLISSVAGGGLASKLSRRFGEGIINGALTARVGLAAMEVCRPLPFTALPEPKIRNILGRAMTGLFDAEERKL